MTRWWRHVEDYFEEQVELRADGARALRGMVAFVFPLALFHWLGQMPEALFVSMTALNLSLPDLRGAYRARLGILATMTLIAAGSEFLGVCCSGHVWAATLAMGLIALGGGVWRHLSADYGPSMAVSSALLFLLGLSVGGGIHYGAHLAGLAAMGGAFATGVQACTWLIRPQHALRYAVAETWVAASDLICGMRPSFGTETKSGAQPVSVLEGELRAALDRTFIILGAAEGGVRSGFISDLEEMRREVVHLTMRALALHTSLEPVMSRREFARYLPALDSALKALGDAARSVAMTLIIHRQQNLNESGVRLRRCEHLLEAFAEQLGDAGSDEAIAQVRSAAAQVVRMIPRIFKALERTVDYGPAGWTYLTSLPEIGTYSARAFGSWMRPSWHIDPVLVRYSLRIAALTMFAVAIYQGFDIPRGYWIAFTIMVVLQPDYGATRQRALHRIGGTLGGVLIASVLLHIKMPMTLLDALATIMALLFAFFLRRRYWVAIFFVTINLVLVMETLSEVHQSLVLTRVLATLCGGGLALLAARLFWPVWEKEKFRALLARAVRANRTFLLSIFGLDETEPLMARRRAENANRDVAESVQRLRGEPKRLREDVDRASSLATYCQRITRALNVLAVQLPVSGGQRVSDCLGEVLEHAAQVIEGGSEDDRVRALNGELAVLQLQLANEASESRDGLVEVQLGKTMMELRAMTLALKGATGLAQPSESE